ncbi:MAG: rhodanese-like domain-containing protein [Verrucomicrobiales bacterium]|jgi:rhodanese-related sulfurtransferase|nr:rhodanese-like domain-containing protein [Verrucomicrobiales bacterium]
MVNVAGKTCLQLGIIVLGATLGTAWTFYFKANRPALFLVQKTKMEANTPLEEILTWSANPVWVDARPETAYAINHIPDAISLRPDNAEHALKAHFEVFMDQRKTFVIYGPEEASHAIAERLEGLGLKKVHRLQGGWKAWQAHHP